jgi:hypothetical protein
MSTNKKPVNPWSSVKLNAFIQKMIGAGVLRDEHPGNALHAAIAAREDLVRLFSKDFPFTKTAIQEHLGSLVWTKGRTKLLEAHYKNEATEQEIAKQFSFLPLLILRSKMRWMRGRGIPKNPPAHVHGLFRIIPDDREIPEVTRIPSSLEKPIVIPNSVAGIIPLQSLMFGLPYDARMTHLVPRCAMEVAARTNHAVVICGGLLHLDVRQASAATANPIALMSALDIDPAVFPPAYRKRVEVIMKDEPNTPIFTTFAEDLENLLSGIKKVFRDTSKSGVVSRFEVPIYLMLTAGERELIDRCAHYEIRYNVLREMKHLNDERARINTLIKADAENREYKDQLSAIDDQIARTLQTYVSKDNRRRACKRLHDFVVQKLLDAIPGAKYVGSGSVVFLHKKKTWRVSEAGWDKKNVKLLDSEMRGHLNSLTLNGGLADVEILTNRWSLYGAMTLLNDTNANDPRFVHVFTPPPTCDVAHVRAHMEREGMFEKRTQTERFFWETLLEPGMFALSAHEGLVRLSRYKIAAVQYQGGMLSARRKEIEAIREKYFTFMLTSDLHVGHSTEFHVRSPKFGLFDLTGAIFHLMRVHHGAGRVHSFLIPDDLSHGANHPYYLQPHEQRLSVPTLEQIRKEQLEKAEGAKTARELRTLHREQWDFTIDQVQKAASYRPEEQIRKLLYMTLIPNADVLGNIVNTYSASSARFVPISAVLGVPKDSRDLTVIAFGNGNHWKNSGIRGESIISEGFIASEIVKPYLIKYVDEAHLPELLAEHSPLVGAPIHGQDALGLARLDTGHHAEYGIALRGSPARYGSANGFGLAETALNAHQRGNYNGIFRDVQMIVEFYGDKHKAAAIFAPGYLGIMSGTAAREDPFSIHGFSRVHNAGVFASLCAAGDDYGPTMLTYCPISWVKDRIEKDRATDFRDILPDPL